MESASSSAEKYQIILEKVPDDRQPAAAIFLSGCFSLPPASTRGIAASGPIALISGIDKSHADSVFKELSTTLPEGVALRLAPENIAEKISRLEWPRPPRIYGRDLDDFERVGEHHDLVCPHCGAMLRISREHDGGLVIMALDEPALKSGPLPPHSANDKDPLFSGIKPMAADTSDYASLKSLQAGDTGFWTDYGDQYGSHHGHPPPPEPNPATIPGVSPKRASSRTAGGSAAFMKPGVFAVVLGRTKDGQAVKMVSEIMGVPEEEARTMCLNLGLCIARDISLDEAQNLLARFNKLGARARIVKPM